MKLAASVILLLAAAALLATAALSKSWYVRVDPGETARFHLRGFDACSDGACQPVSYDVALVPTEQQTKLTEFIWAGRTAFGMLLASAALCLATILLTFLGKDGWIDRHLAGWTAFLGAWAGLAFCDWKPTTLLGVSAGYPLYLAFAGVVLAGLGEVLASDAALERRVRR